MRFCLLVLFFVSAVSAGCATANAKLVQLDLKVFKNTDTNELVFEGKPTKITDGDTITLAEIIKIRMNGIDAPESKQRCLDENDKEYNCGALATEHLKQIIDKDKVRCTMHKYDRYGRFIMTCRKPNGEDIHAQMVRDGYAVISTYDPELYLAEEQYARENKRGIWRGKFRHPHCFRHQKKQDWTVPNLCENNKYYPDSPAIQPQ